MWQGNDKAAFHWRDKHSKGTAPSTWQKLFNSDVKWEMLGDGSGRDVPFGHQYPWGSPGLFRRLAAARFRL